MKIKKFNESVYPGRLPEEINNDLEEVFQANYKVIKLLEADMEITNKYWNELYTSLKTTNKLVSTILYNKY